MQHLCLLLAAPDPAVVSATLTALMTVAKKPSQPNARFAGDERLNDRLHTMASGWGGKEQGLDLLACVIDDAVSIQQVLSSPWLTAAKHPTWLCLSSAVYVFPKLQLLQIQSNPLVTMPDIAWKGSNMSFDMLQGVQRTNNLQYSFYRKASGAGTLEGRTGETCKVAISAVHEIAKSEHELLKETVEEKRIPANLRYDASLG